MSISIWLLYTIALPTSEENFPGAYLLLVSVSTHSSSTVLFVLILEDIVYNRVNNVLLLGLYTSLLSKLRFTRFMVAQTKSGDSGSL